MNQDPGSSKITVVVSGAAGGLGTALVSRFVENQYKVIAIDNNSNGIQRLNTIENVTALKVDITDYKQLRTTMESIQPELSGMSVLICLAGIYYTFPITEEDPDRFKRIIDVNLLGTANMIQMCLNPLINNKGRVVVVSSESYKIQTMFQPYMVSKAALEAYCRAARQELALKDIRLTVIRPGAINTPLLKWMETDYNPETYPVFGKEFSTSLAKSKSMVGKIVSSDKVAQKIFEVAVKKKPKRVYRINNNPLLTLMSVIPKNLLDLLIIGWMKRKYRRTGY
jgi:2-hydroxycyclohexanecarboxyl-CoA dehydrogenase